MGDWGEDLDCVGMLLVILTCLASDGHGLNHGDVQGERWRQALGRAAAVAIPLRVFFEHSMDVATWRCRGELEAVGKRFFSLCFVVWCLLGNQ